jgi:hypothetical protein
MFGPLLDGGRGMTDVREAQHWLIIERFENWKADEANGFAFFGLPPRYSNPASAIRAGDQVYCYVSSGISAFSDIRIVREAGIRRIKEGSFQDVYNRDFAYYFTTSPVLVLRRASWIPLSQLAPKLELTRDRTPWSRRAVFQTSIRKLSPTDAALIASAIRSVSDQDLPRN